MNFIRNSVFSVSSCEKGTRAGKLTGGNGDNRDELKTPFSLLPPVKK